MTVAARLARLLIDAADEAGLPLHATVQSGVGRGIKINLRNATRSYIEGTNELPVQRCLERLLKTGDVFLDLGSNIGFFALIAARLVGPAGRVYAVEPVPANVRCIKANATRNGLSNIHVVEAAAGAEPGTAELMLARHSGGATLSRADTPPDLKGRMRVAVVTVDGLVAAGKMPPPAVVKLDVEGAEIAALKGMERTLAEHRPRVLFEVDDAEDAVAREKYARVADLLGRFGYAVEPLERSYAGLPWSVIHALATPAAHRRLRPAF